MCVLVKTPGFQLKYVLSVMMQYVKDALPHIVR